MNLPRRSIQRALIALLLFCCLITLALWIISYAHPAQGGINKLTSTTANDALFYEFDSSTGVLSLSRTTLHTTSSMRFSTGWKANIQSPPPGPLFTDPSPTILARLGLHAIQQSWQGGSIQIYAVRMPWWVPLLFFASLTALVIRRANTRRHQDPNLCPVCHYDLRATPDRCPECGTVTPK